MKVRENTPDPDRRVEEIIGRYTWGAAAAMIAIPIPGADMAATFAVWGRMIAEIARAYGHDLNLDDGRKLASELFRSVILTAFAWFASAQTAASLLKFIPGAGTVTAYLVDATIAGLGARKITATLGTAAAAYYKSGKTVAPRDIVELLKEVAADPRKILKVLDSVSPPQVPKGPA